MTRGLSSYLIGIHRRMKTTLVQLLSLPVKHKGESLLVRHMGQERSYDLEPGRANTKCQWVAFFRLMWNMRSRK